MEEPDVQHVMTSTPRPSSATLSIHRSDDLQPFDRAKIDGIPCVTPTRLLCHLGGALDEEGFEVVMEEALRRRMTSVERLNRRLEDLSGRGRRGTSRLRRVLEARGGEPAAESFLEVRAIRLLRRARLRPARQYPVGRRRIDLAFPDVKLGIELLGGAAHDGAAARARDAGRHNELAALGWTILYFTYEDVVTRPGYVLATVKAELKRLCRAQALF
jgi:very-short-patch-repair endonuclease